MSAVPSFGLLFGILAALYTAPSNALALVVLVAFFPVLCAAPALRFGDRFWYSLRHLKWFSS